MAELEFDINKNVDIFRVHKASDLEAAPGQTQNARRISGVSKENSAADKIWFGKVYTGPGEISDRTTTVKRRLVVTSSRVVASFATVSATRTSFTWRKATSYSYLHTCHTLKVTPARLKSLCG